ncbi:hypothetical protein ACFPOU_04610 [Massilia jejuensis]|uniref:Uncharacterized protein n=1 Tax=Massilia jejuensis TaxID=648894 RepID=A0ABW0PCP7_9BURK
MLRTDQKAAIRQGFEMGFSDTRIARSVEGINHMQVFNYRHKLKIPTSDIVNRRYDIWTQLIYKGVSIGQIARMYDVTEKSIKVLLWKNRDISLVEAKAQVLKLREENQLLELGDGIPSLGQLGLQFTPISPEEKPTEEALADQETEGQKAG